MSIIKNAYIGADIECFVSLVKTGEIVSAEPYIKGTKNMPFNFDASNKFFATSLDNVLAEICIPPVKLGSKQCKADFVGNINKSFDFVRSCLPKGFCTTHIPSAVLNEEYLNTDNAKLFGCEPDYNVWLREVNEKPLASNPALRSSGFHVHVGFDDPNTEAVEACVKTMDLFLSVPSILIEPENERRKLYGKAGAFRFKDYGFEHRVLSGYFASSEQLKNWVFSNTEAAINFVNAGRFEEVEAVGEQIQEAINSANKELAGNLIRQFEIELV